jgi:N-acetylglucosamine-6-phosphate deacetylase
MTVTALCGASVLVPDGWLENHALVISGDRIAAIVPSETLEVGVDRVSLNGGFLVPGFIDTQVNGGGGVLLNDDPSVDAIATIAKAHRQFGTTGFLPTLISDDLSVVAKAMAAVDAAIAVGVPGVLGIHIEGPFLNAAKRGIHDDSKFRLVDADAVALLSSLTNGKTLVTLAPELAAPGMIAALVERGVVVAAGHSLATYDEMQRAFAQGLSGITHLFNAMSQLESRAPGIVGAGLESRHCISGIIVDGHHVHPASLKIAYAARGRDGLMLVTDAMPSVGTTDKQFAIGGRTITVIDGACRGPDGTLAGSNLNMVAAVRNAMVMMDVDLAAAAMMAGAVPARFLGMAETRGALKAGLQADLVHLDRGHEVTATWVGGVCERVV